MKEIDTNNLLAQLRANAAVAQNQVPGLEAANGQADGPSFSSLLQQSINKVNELQGTSSEMSKAFELGDPSVSLAEVMIAKQKSSIAFQSVLQVRNKLMEAYREVMSMQV
mgnify:CR=1 FL=1